LCCESDVQDLATLEDLEKMAGNLSQDHRVWGLKNLVVSEDGQIIHDEGEESDSDEGEQMRESGVQKRSQQR
jgi:hypothetical protein